MARILVIDDEVDVLMMLRDMLENAGYEVMVASDGREAMTIHRNTPADLIITDLIMPEKEGIETIMELKQGFPEVKIIAISGGGRVGPEGYLDIAKQLGAAHAFAKPVDRDLLIGAIQELLA